ncbi:beta-galactosidase [Cohnella nanjingensis]|uniref:Beta-galactosidase n=1 Tax=Cohnella nanjingensis TaxID=1387779 RepID=A0A7X0RNF5_9BACL|nr:beta-galactosidase [Cohnella nanjingensis]MBB6670739.1 beta-galactosidase [Cohnella nanjingensis]
MSAEERKSRLRYGGDYNPEQWPEETVERDIALMTAADVNTVTLNVFGWGAIQPAPDRYDFDRLDRLFDALERSGIDVILATPTAAPPAWMFEQDPTLRKVDEHGLRVPHWSRQGYCPNHPLYDREIRRIAGVLAERYGKRRNLVLWHINNEYIVHCYCDRCAAAFRSWLQDKYGSLERLNEAWQLSQWSLQRTDWAQISPPIGGMAHTSVSLDYQRFLSDSNLRTFLAEKAEIVRITPDIPVTTNFYALDFRGQIHHQWAPHLDVISWDSYPPHRDHAVWAAFQHDYFRSLKQQPFLLMEQATSSVNWKPYNPAKRPGMMRLQSYQALARGAEAILFFQIRQSRGGVEKFHSALVSHGTETDNRIFREVRQLGAELASLDELGRGRTEAQVAVLFDATLAWLVDWNKGSRDVSYRDAVTAFYRPLYEGNVAVDVVHPLADLSRYEVVVAPMLYMFEDGVPERLREYVQRGGKLVMGYLSGMVNGCDVVEHGGFLRPIDDVFGICVEEWDAFEPEMSNRIRWLPADKRGVAAESSDEAGTVEAAVSPVVSYLAEKWAEVVHLRGAEALAVFEEDYHAGAPAVTRHRYGRGEAYYVATHPEDAFLRELLLGICRANGPASAGTGAPAGVEVSVRERGNARYWFVLNHRPDPVAWEMPAAAGGYDLLGQRHLSDGRIALEGYGAIVFRQGGAGPA